MNEVLRTVRRIRRRLTALSVCVMVCATSAQAQDPPAVSEQRAASEQPLTVDESVRLGLAHNARIRSADADAAAARAALREAQAALLPSVRSAANYTRIGGDIPSADFMLPGVDTAITLLPLERDRYHLEVSLEQPLFTGGRLRQGARAAEREADAAERLADQERADVAFEIRRAYWALYGALSALGATDAALARIETHVTDVRSRFDAGSVLRSELLAAQTRRSEIMLERVESQNAVRVAQLELNRLTGRPLSADITLAASVEVEALPAEPALPGDAILARPQIQALIEQVSGLRAQLAAAQGGVLPEIGFVSRYIYARPNPYSFTDQSSFRGTWEAGLSLQWNVWEGGAQSARVQQVRERLRAAESRLEDARRQAEVDLTREYLETQRAAEAVSVAGENVEQAAESLRVTREQFREGATLSAQVLEAEQAYQQAQARIARAEADYATARAALLHALGAIW